MALKPKIQPCLWFDGNAEQAVEHYVSIFKDSKVLGMSRYGDAGPGPKGSVLEIEFLLDGQQLTALNGGPQFKFSEAVSMVVTCENQAELDDLWSRLSEGGQQFECGWLKDRFGLSWQVVPSVLSKMMRDPDAQRANRVMEAVLKMKKLDIAQLERAYRGRSAA